MAAHFCDYGCGCPWSPRPFGLQPKRFILTPGGITLPDREAEPSADLVSTTEVYADDDLYGIAWAGAGPEAR